MEFNKSTVILIAAIPELVGNPRGIPDSRVIELLTLFVYVLKKSFRKIRELKSIKEGNISDKIAL